LLEKSSLKPYPCYIFRAMLLTGLGVILTACGIATSLTKPTPTLLPSPTSTITPVPTSTSTPTLLPPTAVLLAPEGADGTYVSYLQTALNDVITGQGYRWLVRQKLSLEDLVPELRLVVAVPPDPGLAQLAASAPDTQFLALGIQGLEAAPNLTVIASDNSQPDQQGFIAGVIAAMLAPDWRVGVISVADTVEGQAARTGFLNGAVYFCGLCLPAHPPVYDYPLYFELPLTASSAEWQEAANYMVDRFAEVVYVHPAAGDEAMLATLADAGVNIVSSGEPPQSIADQWIVSLTIDPFVLIQKQVETVLSGGEPEGQSLVVPITFTHVNPALFTPGKQKLAEQILSELQNGYIDTGVDLTTGENRP
jgi:hypothetical protein